ncbi:unnamed protein product [Laminaria digitata]
MMFRRFLSPRYAVIAVAVTVTLLLGCDLATAQASEASPAPTAVGTSDTPTTTSASDEQTASSTADKPTADDDEPGGSSLDCMTEFSGDSLCDEDNNSEICGYDGGDCCACTCVSSDETDNKCGGNYNCIDPDATCVNDDDGDGGTLVEDDDTNTATDDIATDDTNDGDSIPVEDTEMNESDAASGLFAGANLARIIIATVAAIGLVAVAP